MERRGAGGSEAHVAQAAREVILRGNAVDAVVAAVLVAAAESPGVMLGPVQLLVGGAGAGLLAVDGRVRQPGLGIPRPRGVVAGDAVPLPARVGVPALPVALATALAAVGSMTLQRVAALAVDRARVVSPERAAVLRGFGRRGAAIMTDEAIASELVAVAGRAAGGSLTHEDLAAVRPVILACDEPSLAPSGILRMPWREGTRAGTATQVVAAADGKGLTAVACYEVALDGLAVPSLGLTSPGLAAPVMRGQTRVRPGEPCSSAAPVALRVRRGVIEVALGLAQSDESEAHLDGLLAALDDTAALLEAVRACPGRPVLLTRTGEAVGVVASA